MLNVLGVFYLFYMKDVGLSLKFYVENFKFYDVYKVFYVNIIVMLLKKEDVLNEIYE